MTGRRTARLPALDGLRGLAVLLVMAYHSDAIGASANDPATPVVPGGWTGVDIFFVLSGYLITRNLLDTTPAPHALKDFYSRRFRRLGPAALVLLLVWSVAAATGWLPLYWAGHGSGSRLWLTAAPVIGLLSLSYNWWIALGTPNPYGMGQLWSLTIEEQFYLVWPTVVLAFWRRGSDCRRRLFLGCAAVMACGLCYAGVAVKLGHRDLAYFGTPTRMIGLVLGACVAMTVASDGKRRPPRTLAAVCAYVAAMCLAVFAATAADSDVYVAPMVSFAVAVIVYHVATDSVAADRWFRWSWLRWCGRRSYAMYLWHSPWLLVWRHAVGDGWRASALAASAAVVSAVLSWRIVESRFLGSRTPATRPGGVAPSPKVSRSTPDEAAVHAAVSRGI